MVISADGLKFLKGRNCITVHHVPRWREMPKGREKRRKEKKKKKGKKRGKEGKTEKRRERDGVRGERQSGVGGGEAGGGKRRGRGDRL